MVIGMFFDSSFKLFVCPLLTSLKMFFCRIDEVARAVRDYDGLTSSEFYGGCQDGSQVLWTYHGRIAAT